jgi:hypothetical protein
MSSYLNSKENLALELVFGLLGEERCSDTGKDYADIIARLPPIKVLHGQINDRLKAWAKAGFAPHQVCHFKVGDRYPQYEEFPTSLSLETLRSALVKSGMRTKGRRKPRSR